MLVLLNSKNDKIYKADTIVITMDDNTITPLIRTDTLLSSNINESKEVTKKLEGILEKYLSDIIFTDLIKNQDLMFTTLRPLNYTLKDNKLIDLRPLEEDILFEKYFNKPFKELSKEYQNLKDQKRTIVTPSKSSVYIDEIEEKTLRDKITNDIIKPYRIWHRYFIDSINPSELKDNVRENLNGIPFEYCKEQLTYIKNIPDNLLSDGTRINKKYFKELIEFNALVDPTHKEQKTNNINQKIKKHAYTLLEKIGIKLNTLKQNSQNKFIVASLGLTMSASGSSASMNNTQQNQVIHNNPQKVEISSLKNGCLNYSRVNNIGDLIANYNRMNYMQIAKTQSNLQIEEKQLYTKINEERENGFKVKYSSKLIEYSENDLREKIIQIYAFSKSTKDTLNELKEKLNINMSISSLYREINKYKKERKLTTRVDGNTVLKRTNKYLLRKEIRDTHNNNNNNNNNSNNTTVSNDAETYILKRYDAVA